MLLTIHVVERTHAQPHLYATCGAVADVPAHTGCGCQHCSKKPTHQATLPMLKHLREMCRCDDVVCECQQLLEVWPQPLSLNEHRHAVRACSTRKQQRGLRQAAVKVHEPCARQRRFQDAVAGHGAAHVLGEQGGTRRVDARAGVAFPVNDDVGEGRGMAVGPQHKACVDAVRLKLPQDAIAKAVVANLATYSIGGVAAALSILGSYPTSTVDAPVL